jgi:hypothetical protein
MVVSSVDFKESVMVVSSVGQNGRRQCRPIRKAIAAQQMVHFANREQPDVRSEQAQACLTEVLSSSC